MQLSFKSPLVPLSLLILIDHIGYGILYPILVPLFMGENSILGAEAPEIMKSFWYNMTLAVFPISLFFGATLLGSLSDQYGRKKVLLLCILGAVLSYFLGGLAIDFSSAWLLIFSRCTAGLTAGSMPIAQAAIIDISSEKDRSSNLGLIILAASLGFLMGPLIGGLFANTELVSWFSYSTPFYVASILALINAAFLIYGFKETYVPSIKQSFDWYQYVEVTLAPFKLKEIRFLSLIFFLMQLGWGFYFQFVAVFLLKKFSFSSQDISIYMTMMGLGFAVGSCVAIRWLSRFFSERNLALLALFIASLSTLFTVLGIHISLNWLLSFMMGCSMAMVYSLMIKFYSMTVSEDRQGFIMGVSEAVISVAFAVTPLISTYLENINLSLPLMFATLLLGLGTILFPFWRMPGERRVDALKMS